PGGVCFYFKTENILVSGDCLFQGGIGRTDLPGGDARILSSSLDRIMRLPDQTVVYAGHGPATTIGRERKTNPFLLDRSWAG
ncbi:MAG: MBL fold metallo-hydrolase, partial [Kiritimatiellae bacterium]|nr:MBL fold metallo-hydrolase [Kiritimatiellia bacterium]